MSESKKVRLGEVCQIFGRIGFRGYTINDFVESKDQGAISLSPTNIIDGEINIDKCSYISWNKYYESPEIMICKNDILIVKTGSSFGRTAIVKEVKHQMTINPQFVVLKNININPIYLSYYIKSKSFQNQISSIIVGSAIPTLSQKNLANLVLKIQDSQTQYNIAGILSSLDAKIETNNKLNEKLEEMAQAIFKSWFVDFEPFKNQPFYETELGMIPEGWEVKTVDEFCRIFTGKKNTNQSDANGIYPFFSCAPDPLRSNDYLYDGYAVIIAGNGSYTGRTQLYNGKFDLYQRTYACVAKEKFFNDKIVFIYLMMKHGFEREKMGGTRGSSIPYIVMNDIAKQTFCYNKNVIGNFCNIVRPVMDFKHKLQIESARLASLRDTLLPRLMSGEIKI